MPEHVALALPRVKVAVLVPVPVAPRVVTAARWFLAARVTYCAAY